MPRIVRKTNKTVLLAVEGETELAFVTHLKQSYLTRNCNVSIKIKNAHGFGPLGIMDALINGSRGKSYDHMAALFDSDIPICRESGQFFQKNNVKLFQSIPAIEGTILRLGNIRTKQNISTDECKRLLARNFVGDAMDVRFYERHFQKHLIDANRANIQILDDLINYILDPE